MGLLGLKRAAGVKRVIGIKIKQTRKLCFDKRKKKG
jgi:hypothetical protein